jgi:glycosyltransferase involved in cell wall biosynthesis
LPRGTTDVKNPKASVVMSVHNEERYVSKAIRSILEQTFDDFEFIIIDDDSTDGTTEILSNYQQKDARIRVLRHQSKKGLAQSLNEGIRIAQGRYIARMDADDISLPTRLEKQVAFLDMHPEVGLVGTLCYEVDENDVIVRRWSLPSSTSDVRKALLDLNPLVHTSVMIRKEVFAEIGYYDETLQYSQDYELWLRIARKYEIANLPEPLVMLRVDLEKAMRKDAKARKHSLYVRFMHLRQSDAPAHYYLHLLRPFLLVILPSRFTIWLKKLKRYWNQLVPSEELRHRRKGL